MLDVHKMVVNLHLSFDPERGIVWINSTFLENNSLIVEAEEDTKNDVSKTIWSILLLINLLIFIITKLTMLKLTLTPASILQNPHNTLFFIDEMEKLIVIPTGTVIVVYDVFNNVDSQFSTIIPNCWIRVVFPLLPSIMFFGGAAIALLRLIAVRYTHLMARWGQFKIMFTILFLWQAALITNTYLMFISNAGKQTYPCKNVEESVTINYRPGFLFLFAIATEFVIYIAICHFVYKSDIEVRQFISSGNYVRRKRKSAVNMFGHAMYFIIEIAIMIGTIILANQSVPSLKVFNQFSSTLLAIFMLLLSTPMKVKWSQSFIHPQEKSRGQKSNGVIKKPKITPIDQNAADTMEMKSM